MLLYKVDRAQCPFESGFRMHPPQRRFSPTARGRPSEHWPSHTLTVVSDHTWTPSDMPIVIICDAFEILGVLILTAVFLTAWRSRRVRRASTWFLFIFSCILSSFSSLLILGQQSGSAPNWNLCLAQATMIYSSAVFTAFSAAAFTIQIYISMISLEKAPRVASAFRVVSLHIVPTIISMGIFTMTLIMGIFNRPFVQRDPSGIRCHIGVPLVSRIVAGVGISGVVVVLIIQGHIAFKLCRSWKTYEISLHENRTSPNVVIRVFVFTLLAFILLVVGLLTYLPAHTTSPATASAYNIAIAFLPPAAGLVFGTQRDMLEVWMFWKRSQPPTLLQSDVESSETIYA